jgi:hypothetical protein
MLLLLRTSHSNPKRFLEKSELHSFNHKNNIDLGAKETQKKIEMGGPYFSKLKAYNSTFYWHIFPRIF